MFQRHWRGVLYLSAIVATFWFAATVPKDGGHDEICLSTCDVYVDRVIDGDTFTADGFRVRIESINAPELDQSGGPEAHLCLANAIQGRTVTINPHGLDVYGRTLASVMNVRINCP
jgi:endonuclease YncB( thermonuclease family)